MITADQPEVPPGFLDALRSLRATQVRPQVRLLEVPAPRKIAPYAAALDAELVCPTLDEDTQGASGRFIVLHDPDGQDAWQGTYRIVTHVRASLDPEMGADPLLAAVAWSWLRESLAEHGALGHALGGTITKVVSESFGALSDHEPETEVEIRASWTPTRPGHRSATPVDLGPDLAAWTELLWTTTGLPTYPDGVTPFPQHRGPRGVA